MIFTFEWKNFLVELERGNAKVWKGEGLPSYEGALDGAMEKYPELANYMLERGIVRQSSN